MMSCLRHPRRFLGSQRGAALLAVLGFALLALAFVVIAFTESDNQVRQVGLEMRQQQSLAACELGFSAAIARLNLGESPDFDGDLATLQAACKEPLPTGDGTDPAQSGVDDDGNPIATTYEPLPLKAYRDPNDKDDDGDGYADFEEAPSFAEQKALFAKRPSGSFAVRGIKIDDDTYKLRVFGVHDRDVRVLEAIVRRQGSPLLGGGAGFFGAQKLKIEEDGFLDSYVSGGTSSSVIAAGAPAQTYNPSSKEIVVDGVASGETATYGGSNVLVGSNEKLEIKKDSRVIATTIIGPDGEVKNEGTTYAPTRELTDPIEDEVRSFPIPATNNNAEIESGLVIEDDFFVPANSGYVLGQTGESKVYVFDKFKTKKEASGTIRGDVVIYVTNEMKFDQSTVLALEPGATLTIFTNNKVSFSKNLQVNDKGYPAAVQINSGVLTDDPTPPDIPTTVDGDGNTVIGPITYPDGSIETRVERPGNGSVTTVTKPDGTVVETDINNEGNGVERTFPADGSPPIVITITAGGDDDDDDDDDDGDDNLAPGDIKLDISGSPSAAFYGVINAPGVKVVIEKDANFFGGIRGRQVTLKEDGNFHYDESLSSFSNTNTTTSRFTLVAFNEVR